MDKIFLRGLQVETIIGIHAWEQRAPRPLILDLVMGTDIREAASSDHVRDAIDYAAVTAAVVKFVSETQVGLLETLAAEVAERMTGQEPAPIPEPDSPPASATLGQPVPD